MTILHLKVHNCHATFIHFVCSPLTIYYEGIFTFRKGFLSYSALAYMNMRGIFSDIVDG